MKIYAPQITGSLAINGTSIGNFNNLVSTSSFNQYTSSISTGSLATTGSNTFVGNQTMSGSIIPAVTNTYDLGDDTHQFRHLYLSSGSLYINGTKVLGATGQELQITSDAGQSIKILEAGSDTITLQSADGNITLATSGNGDVIVDPTSGIIALKGTTTLYAGNKLLSSDGNAIQFGNDLSVTGSLTTTTGNVNGVNVSSLSSSVASAIPNLNNATSSIQSFTSSINTRVTNLENADLTFATTGSNIFKGNQIVSASMYVTGDLVVYGSSSIQNISSSTLSIGTNVIQLNTATPAVRFAGLQVIDSGSTAMSASLFWDSVNNHWIYQRESGAVYGGGMLISGPRNLGALGDEVGITSKKLVVGLGGDHISSSAIYHDDTTTSFPNNIEVSGSATITTLNAGNGIVSGSTQVKNLLPDGSVSGSEQVVGILSSLNSATSSYETKGRSIVSGSSQIDVMSTTNIAKLATTGSNIFIGNQTITGSLSITGSLIGMVGDGISINRIGGQPYVYLRKDSTDLGSIYGKTGGGLILYNATTEAITIDSSANVSINKSGAGLLTLGASTSYGSVSSGAGGATIYLNGATRGGTTTAASNTIVVATDGEFYITNGAANSTKFLVGSTGIVTTGVIKGDSGTNYPHSFTNSDAANTHWTNRDNRLLTSNGSNWAGDGKDPIMALVSGNNSTVRGNAIGLAMHHEGQSDGTYSPMIAFSNKSNSGNYNTTYAAIMGKKTGQANDTNWSSGELHFFASPVGTYMGDTPNFLLSSTAATFSGTLTENSSIRYKENVETIKYGLDKILQMRGVTYYKKDNGVKEMGVIAEEVYDILPEVVLKNEEGEIDSVSYGRIVGVLIEAIKEQQKQIEELKSLIK